MVASKRSGDYNLSDIEPLSMCDTVATLSVTKAEAEYVEDIEGIMFVDEYIESCKDYTLTTSEGDMTIPDVDEDSFALLHFVPDGAESKFKNDDIISWMVRKAEDNSLPTRFSRGLRTDSDIVYIPLSAGTEMHKIAGAVFNSDTKFGTIQKDRYSGPMNRLVSKSVQVYSTDAYMQARFSDWSDKGAIYNLGTGLRRSDSTIGTEAFDEVEALLATMYESDMEIDPTLVL